MGNALEALTYFEQALAIDKVVVGTKNPKVAQKLNIIGAAWKALGEPQKAIGPDWEAVLIPANQF